METWIKTDSMSQDQGKTEIKLVYKKHFLKKLGRE